MRANQLQVELLREKTGTGVLRGVTKAFRAVDREIRQIQDSKYEPEAIHRLRVTCRRAATLLWMLRLVEAPIRLRKIRRFFQKTRQLAGKLRDADIRILEFRNLRLEPAASAYMQGALTWEHAHAFADWRSKKESRHMRLQTAEKHWRRRSKLDKSLRESSWKWKRMAGWINDHWRRLTRLSEKPQSTEQFHLERIAIKRLRYALESLRYRKNPALESIQSWLREMQECLGQIRDQQMIQDWLERLELPNRSIRSGVGICRAAVRAWRKRCQMSLRRGYRKHQRIQRRRPLLLRIEMAARR